MPNPGSDRPLRKVTLNLYEDDCAAAEYFIGPGWTTVLRDRWRDYLNKVHRNQDPERKPRTLGDLDHD